MSEPRAQKRYHMGWTIGGEIGRSKRAKGWILYRLEDEIAEASAEYASALDEQHALLKSKDARDFSQVTRRSTLVQALWKAQLKAGLVREGDELREPLAESVRDAVQ